ncbi:Nucleoside recognition [Amphibacillus marinus]|uniref:Nucleoside recognition n=1 Tax=Amphibacillus marinus TaxID=872970 RepID=A0A1H8RS27_9BACI|nr:nucleoside recognition domain-containing protein [Amphibacillus marinus]SEO69087.1 Nucleoside recognition [Amphibacillus marinus]
MGAILVRGLKQGINVTWTLSKVIFPITLLISLLQFTPVLPWLINLVRPLMGLFGLSGEAAVPLVLGNSLNLYAAIGALVSFEFTVKEVFIMAVMLSFSHNLFVESSVAIKVGLRWPIVIGVRLLLASLSAIIIQLSWSGGQEVAQYGFVPTNANAPEGIVEIGLEAITKASTSIIQLMMIVIPLMIIMQFFRDLGWMSKISQAFSPFTKILGIKPNASMTLVAGLSIGLAFGAGVMVQAVKEDGVAKKDMYLSFIFLVACHAVIEDTLIFIPLGIPVWPLLIIRLVTAICLTACIAFFWRQSEYKERKESIRYEN